MNIMSSIESFGSLSEVIGPIWFMLYRICSATSVVDCLKSSYTRKASVSITFFFFKFSGVSLLIVFSFVSFSVAVCSQRPGTGRG